MKALSRTLAALALLASFSVSAEDAPAMPTSPEAAKEMAQQMTPEQKQAMKQQAQAKQEAWQQMTPEQKQTKRQEMRSRMQQRTAQFRQGRR